MRQAHLHKTYKTFVVYNTTMSRRYFVYFAQHPRFVWYDALYKTALGLCSLKNHKKNGHILSEIPLCIAGIMKKNAQFFYCCTQAWSMNSLRFIPLTTTAWCSTAFLTSFSFCWVHTTMHESYFWIAFWYFSNISFIVCVPGRSYSIARHLPSWRYATISTPS